MQDPFRKQLWIRITLVVIVALAAGASPCRREVAWRDFSTVLIAPGGYDAPRGRFSPGLSYRINIAAAAPNITIVIIPTAIRDSQELG